MTMHFLNSLFKIQLSLLPVQFKFAPIIRRDPIHHFWILPKSGMNRKTAAGLLDQKCSVNLSRITCLATIHSKKQCCPWIPTAVCCDPHISHFLLFSAHQHLLSFAADLSFDLRKRFICMESVFTQHSITHHTPSWAPGNFVMGLQ